DHRGYRWNVGEAFWAPLGDDQDRLKGIVVVAATGGGATLPTVQRARAAVDGAIRCAVANLPRDRALLLALPAVGHGAGRDKRDLLHATREVVRTATATVAELEAKEPGRVIDVVFVTFTPVSYRLFVEARRESGLEPASPLDPAQAADLLASLQQRRC